MPRLSWPRAKGGTVSPAIDSARVRRTAGRAARLVREPGRIPAVLRRRLRRAPAPPPVAAPPPTQTRADRLALITAHVDLAGVGLEIGPSHNPLLPKAAGYDVRIADYLDQDGLVAKYDGLRPTAKIETVDYVLQAGRMTESISDRFDYIVASHVMEHTVCLVSFLQDCQALLRPGGALTLAVPDHRYCFDRFRERTALGRVVDVYRAAPTVHSEGSVLEHNLNMVFIGDKVAWSRDTVGEYHFPRTLADAVDSAAPAGKGEYVDVHNWVFTPHHCRLLLADLFHLGLIGLREKAFHHTIGPEFYLTLSAQAPGPALTRTELVVLADRESATTGALVFG